MSAARPEGAREHLQDGFSLIEVVAALGILSVTLIAMVGQFLGARAAADGLGRELAVRPGRMDAVGATPEQRGGGSPWGWSAASIDSAVWRPEGLRVVLRLPEDPGALEVGWWVDGWWGGTRRVGAEEEGALVVTELRGTPAGREVVLRVRREGEPWGVPWRSIGCTDGVGAERALAAGEGVVGADPSLVVVHGSAAGIPALSVDGAGLSEGGVGEWPALVRVGQGVAEVECDGRVQGFRVEAHGSLHLYY